MITPVVTHVGTCVTDLDASERFYVEALGFTRVRDLRPPDGVTGKLLRVERPVGLTAVYLECGSFTLELLHFDRPGNAPRRERSMTEPGLTHLSITVDDLDDARGRVTEHGGHVLDESDVQLAVLVTDPDGQIIELLARTDR